MGIASSVLLALHLVCMNVVAAGPLVAAWLDRKASYGDKESQSAIRRLMALCCVLIPVGAVLGLGMGWLYWSDAYHEIVSRFGYRIRWGIIEFAFSAALIVLYTGWIWVRPRAGTGAWSVRTLLAVATSTNLLYHFPPLFSLMASAAAGDLSLEQDVDSATFRRLLMHGEVLALSTHFAIASFAVTGVALALLASGRWNALATNARIAVWGARMALVSTLCQLPAGIWLLMRIPASEQRRLLGGDIVAATLFVSALMGTFWLLHQLAAVAFGDTSRGTIRRATMALFLVVLLMTGTLQRGQRYATKMKPMAREQQDEKVVQFAVRASRAPEQPRRPHHEL